MGGIFHQNDNGQAIRLRGFMIKKRGGASGETQVLVISTFLCWWPMQWLLSSIMVVKRQATALLSIRFFTLFLSLSHSLCVWLSECLHK
jgi:hypothetical protein